MQDTHGYLPEVLTVQDVRNFLRVSRTKAYEIAKDPEFPAVIIGGCIRIPRKEFLDWFSDQKNGRIDVSPNLKAAGRGD